jgi:disintegrin and metalloproteinase domain-containing protein 17
VQDVVQRFWHIIEDININKLLVFLRDNIVGTVIVVTAFIWIPASCVVSYVDRRRKLNSQEANAEWKNSSKFSSGDNWQPVNVNVAR